MAEEIGWQAHAEALREILSGKKPEELDSGVVNSLIAHRLLTREDVTMPCRTCGTERPYYSYWKVYAAGRLLVKALDEVIPPGLRADG